MEQLNKKLAEAIWNYEPLSFTTDPAAAWRLLEYAITKSGLIYIKDGWIWAWNPETMEWDAHKQFSMEALATAFLRASTNKE